MDPAELLERAQPLLAQVDAARLRDLTMELVRIPSWPGEERAVAQRYAEMLYDAGLHVEWETSCPESPSVVGQWQASVPGPTLQLDGHTDTVPVEHPAPEFKDGVLFGRGSCDMKCGLAAIAEVCRILTRAGAVQGAGAGASAGAATRAGLPLRGGLLVTAHGQHEKPAPGRRLHEPLLKLFERGIKGDHCIIPEGPEHELAISGKGLFIWEATFRREGEPIHEVKAAGALPHPLMAGHRFIALLQERARGWTLDDPLVGREYFFVGGFQSGDLYNVVPTSCRLEGVRRYPFGRTFEEARADFDEVAAQVARETGVEVDLHIMKSGQPYRLAEHDPVVRAVRWGYQAVAGREMPLAGLRLSGDVSQFNNDGGIPAVYCGIDGERAHGTPEYARLDEIVRGTKTLLLAALHYLCTEQ
jgi:acetylornithine deacetylase/succinyl-diaminopimelate desuccinylase-like protein